MAVSDMIILPCLPFDLYRLSRSIPWIFVGFLCKFLWLVIEGCTSSTNLHITALSLEICVVICFPLKVKVFITKRRVKMVMVLLWAIALLSATPFYNLLENVQIFNYTALYEISWQCTFTKYAMESGLLKVMMWVTTLYFFFPMLCLTVLYDFIGKKLWKSKNTPQSPNAMKILAAVVLTLMICWLPFHIGRIIYVKTKDVQIISQYFLVVMQLFYLKTSINPILYNFISKEYRTAAYKLLRLSTSD